LLSYLTDIITDFVTAEADKARIKNPKLYHFNHSCSFTLGYFWSCRSATLLERNKHLL